MKFLSIPYLFTNNGETIYSMLVDEGTTLNDSYDPVKNGTIQLQQFQIVQMEN